MEERKSVREEKIIISKEEIKKYEDKVAREIASRVKIPGFRPGKAPISLVKKHYGEYIESRAIEKALDDKIRELAGERDWIIIGTPEIVAKSEMDDAYEYTLRFEVYPKIEIPDLTQIKVKKRIRKITDADVEEEIQHLKEENATLKSVDREVREGDVVLAEFFIRKDGKESKRRRARIFVKASELDEELYNAILGKKAGDQIILPGEEEGEEEVYEIKKVLEMEYPSDEELAELLGYPPDQLRERIRQELVEDAQKEAELFLEEAIIREILRLAPFEPPPSLVFKVYQDLAADMGKDPSEVDEELLQMAAFLVLRDLVILRLIDEKDIEITEEDIIKYLKEESEENPEQFLKEAKKRGKYEELANKYLIRKAYDYLKQTVQVEPEFV
ncbi:MAG: trigger factor [Thermotogae bacterium]|nr:trigger factor [Thermotogota bacterium]